MYKNGTSDVGRELHRDTHNVDEKIEELGDMLKGFFDQGSQKVDELKSRVIEVKDHTIQRGSDALDRVADLIKTHPLKAIGIAFGAGYIGMRLFRR